jgi:hypothetical protein
MSRPVGAAAVDLYRVLVGLLVMVYFVRLALEFPLYTAEDGLLDHQLHRQLFWFTKFTLLFPGSSPIYKWSLLALGALGALALTFGIRPKLGSAVSWIVVISVHRWNFAVINLDDSSITLALWWTLFLPIGNTLTWRTLTGRSDWREEVFREVDGFFVRAFYINLFIYYLTAGLTKLNSVLWSEGLALFVVLQLPLSRTSGWWGFEHFPLLWAGNHYTLIVEPLLPFLVLLPKGYPLKYLGGVCWVALHLAIALSIGVPYANLGLIIALILVFKGEVTDFLRHRAGSHHKVRVLHWQPPLGTRPLVVSYLLILTLAMQKNVPILDKVWEPCMALLYAGGVAQEYHLFDWIDRFNWTIEHSISVETEEGSSLELPGQELFPHSVRGFIVQSYLLPMRWMRVPRPLTGEMRNGILRRAARRFVKTHRKMLGNSGKVKVISRVGRLDQRDLKGRNLWRTRLMEFRYVRDEVTFSYPRQPDLP